MEVELEIGVFENEIFNGNRYYIWLIYILKFLWKNHLKSAVLCNNGYVFLKLSIRSTLY